MEKTLSISECKRDSSRRYVIGGTNTRGEIHGVHEREEKFRACPFFRVQRDDSVMLL